MHALPLASTSVLMYAHSCCPVCTCAMPCLAMQWQQCTNAPSLLALQYLDWGSNFPFLQSCDWYWVPMQMQSFSSCMHRRSSCSCLISLESFYTPTNKRCTITVEPLVCCIGAHLIATNVCRIDNALYTFVPAACACILCLCLSNCAGGSPPLRLPLTAEDKWPSYPAASNCCNKVWPLIA